MGQIVIETGLQLCVRARFIRVRTPGRIHRSQKGSERDRVCERRFLNHDVGKVSCLRLSVGQTHNVTRHLAVFIRWRTALAPMTGR